MSCSHSIGSTRAWSRVRRRHSSLGEAENAVFELLIDLLLWLVPRPSPVTDEVKRLLTTGARHAWSLNELHLAARESLGSADYSSVFGAVAALEREGAIERIEVGDGPARYELSERHHEHIRCDSCGRVEVVAACVLEDATGRIEELTGFKVPRHQVVFGGTCRDCRS